MAMKEEENVLVALVSRPIPLHCILVLLILVLTVSLFLLPLVSLVTVCELMSANGVVPADLRSTDPHERKQCARWIAQKCVSIPRHIYRI